MHVFSKACFWCMKSWRPELNSTAEIWCTKMLHLGESLPKKDNEKLPNPKLQITKTA